MCMCVVLPSTVKIFLSLFIEQDTGIKQIGNSHKTDEQTIINLKLLCRLVKKRNRYDDDDDPHLDIRGTCDTCIEYGSREKIFFFVLH